jgi:tetratricopeptide (TPR) repeat protein
MDLPKTNSNRALGLAEKSVSLESNPASLHTLGTAYFRAGHYRKALEQFRMGRQTGGGSPDFYLFEAMTQFRLGNLQEARRLLEDAVRQIDGLVSLASAEAARDSLSWHQKLELRLLRREAEDLIGTATAPNTPSPQESGGRTPR